MNKKYQWILLTLLNVYSLLNIDALYWFCSIIKSEVQGYSARIFSPVSLAKFIKIANNSIFREQRDVFYTHCDWNITGKRDMYFRDVISFNVTQHTVFIFLSHFITWLNNTCVISNTHAKSIPRITDVYLFDYLYSAYRLPAKESIHSTVYVFYHICKKKPVDDDSDWFCH